MSKREGFFVQQNDTAWEMMWAPYDQPTYQFVLQNIRPDDVVLDIGAGDLRLARQMAQISYQVYAIEIQEALLWNNSLRSVKEENLTFLCGDALILSFPRDISVGVLLMRHCTHFLQYAEKLKEVGCKRLITNARWRFGAEVIDLNALRLPFDAISVGWYACWCGATGFKPGPLEQFTPDMEAIVHETASCPQCDNLKSKDYSDWNAPRTLCWG